MLKGIAASKGIGIGKAAVLREMDDLQNLAGKTVSEPEIENETARFKNALAQTEKTMEAAKAKAAEIMGEAEAQVFEAYRMVLRDPVFISTVTGKMNNGHYSAEAAVLRAVDEIKAMFLSISNDYMRQRAEDIGHVGKSLINQLLGKAQVDLFHLDEDTIVIAKDLAPGDTVSLDRKHVKGFAIEKGGETSHTAIMARTLEIPALVGCGPDIFKIAAGDPVIIDGETGCLIHHPIPCEVEAYTAKYHTDMEKKERVKRLKDLEPVTTDGRHLELFGNIAKPEDAACVLEKGGTGIGLFRTEFLYLDRNSLPTEDEQFEAYKKTAELMGGNPCIVRTMDIGGDKKLPSINLQHEENPFLGYRAIRICLNETELFKTQLRAILRASIYGNLKIMFPMISGVSELRAAKRILEEAKAELQRKGIAYRQDIQVGIMIEIPSAAVAADLLAKESDFFSIGTNDLCQYTLAVDRMNERISHLYDPLNVGVLRLIKKVIDAAHENGIKVGMCGEMASDPVNAVLLLGMGMDELSMVPAAIPYVKEAVLKSSYEAAAEIAGKVINMADSQDIMQCMKEGFYAGKDF